MEIIIKPRMKASSMETNPTTTSKITNRSRPLFAGFKAKDTMKPNALQAMKNVKSHGSVLLAQLHFNSVAHRKKVEIYSSRLASLSCQLMTFSLFKAECWLQKKPLILALGEVTSASWGPI